MLNGYAVAFGVWASTALLMVTQQLVNHLHGEFDLPLALANCAVFLCIALLTPPTFYLGRRFPVTRHIVRRLGLYVLAFFPFLLVYACVRWVVAPPWNADLHRFVDRSWSMFWAQIKNFASIWWMYLEVLLTANALAFYERARTQELERAHLEQALASSELQALKVQLQPHFLFNTLHGIATLAERDGRRAKGMVLQLSTLLRRSLEHGSADLGPLADELEFISGYLELEKMRLGSRLDVRWDVAEDARAALVPQLILQPIVENAIIHGISCSREGGWIEITAERAPHQLLLRVRNSLALCASSGTGLGLKNTAARLKCLYGGDARLSFSLDHVQGHAEARLDVPLLLSRAESALSPAPAMRGE